MTKISNGVKIYLTISIKALVAVGITTRAFYFFAKASQDKSQDRPEGEAILDYERIAKSLGPYDLSYHFRKI